MARLKKYRQALAALDKARQLNPDSLTPLLNRARVHASENQFDKALADAGQAWPWSPATRPCCCFERACTRRKARKTRPWPMSTGLALAPDNVAVLLLRAGVHQEMGEKEKALADPDGS